MKEKVTIYQPDDKKYSPPVVALADQYCPECRQCYTFKKLDNKLFARAGLTSVEEVEVYQCPECKSIFINDLAKLWEQAQKFYKKVFK